MVKKEIWAQILNCIPVTFLSLNLGIFNVWSSPTLYRLQNENFPLTRAQISWIGSLPSYSNIIGCCITCFLMDVIGRRKSIILSSIGFTSQWTILTFSKTVPAILIARAIGGICQSMFFLVVNAYVVENCYPSIRGTLMGLKSFGATIGYVLVNILILYVDYYMAHLILSIMSIAITISLLFIIESPEFLLSRNRFNQAKKSFFSVRSTEKETDVNYFQELAKRSEMPDNFFSHVRKFFRSTASLRGLTILVVVAGLGHMAVVPGVIHSYSNLFFPKGTDKDFVNRVSIIKQMWSVLGGFVAATSLEKFPRRFICKVGYSIYLITMMSMAILCKFHYSENPVEHFNYYVTAILCVIEFMYGAFFFPFMNLIIGELLPQNSKSVGLGLIVMIMAFINGMCSYVFWYVEKVAGIAMNFVLYSAACVFIIVYAHFNMLETKGKTLVQIDNELSGRTNAGEEIVERMTIFRE